MELPTQLIQNRELMLTGVFRYANTWPDGHRAGRVRPGRSGLHGDRRDSRSRRPPTPWTPTGRRVASRRWWPCHETRAVRRWRRYRSTSRPTIATKSASASCISASAASIAPTRRCTSTGCWRRASPRTGASAGSASCPSDRKMKDVLDAQDGLYTLILENPDGTRDARVIGSIVDYRYAPDDPESVIELLAAPTTRIISLTITEGGYNVDGIEPGRRERVRPGGRGPRAAPRPRDRIADDRVVRQHRGQRRGRAAGVHEPTPSACIPGWRSGSSTNTRFPNSMVDRITPATTPEVIEKLRDRVRRRGPMAGRRRAVHLVGARRRLLRRQAAVRGRRRAAGRRRDAVRADEAAAAQRQPPKPLLFRVSRRLPAGARRRGRSAVRRVPDALHGYRGHADAAAGARASTCPTTSAH